MREKIKRMIAITLLLAVVFAMLPYGEPVYAKKVIGNKDWKWPVPASDSISSCYLDGRSHYGIDIRAQKGDKVYAAYKGKVIFAYAGCPNNFPKKMKGCGCGGCGQLGNSVYILHNYLGKKYISRYGHMSKVKVKAGDYVTNETVIGTIGSTGGSTGYHLDLRVYEGTERTASHETCVDPLAQRFLELPKDFNAKAASTSCCKEYAKKIIKKYGKILSNCVDDSKQGKGEPELTGEKFPELLKEGENFNIKGIVKATARIERIAVSVENKTKVIMKQAVIPKAKEYDISQMRKDFNFSGLPVGNYSYRIIVKVKGTSTELLKQSFVVKARKKNVHEIVFHSNGGAIAGKVQKLEIDGYNCKRMEGELIIFNRANATVETNQYGTEIAVDANGKVIAVRKEGSNRKLTVPKGGVVISGHNDGSGKSGGEFLKKIRKGYYVSVDETAGTVTCYSTLNKYLEKQKVVLSKRVYGKLPVPTRSGYQFMGWYTAKRGGEKITRNSKYVADELHARWKKIEK